MAAAERRGRGWRPLGAAALAAVGLGIGWMLAAGGAAAPPPSEHDPDEVRRLADEILARDEFAPPARGPLQAFFDWLTGLFEGSQPRVPEGTSGGGIGLPAGGGGGSAILTVVLLVAAALLLGWVVWALRGRLHWRRRAGEDGVDVEVEPRLSVDEWEQLAHRHEAEGRWKEGLRCRFRGLVERLVTRGAVPDIPGRTAGELRVDLRETVPEAADDFAATAELFERAWYGDLPTGPEEATRFERHARAVLAATGERS